MLPRHAGNQDQAGQFPPTRRSTLRRHAGNQGQVDQFPPTRRSHAGNRLRRKRLEASRHLLKESFDRHPPSGRVRVDARGDILALEAMNPKDRVAAESFFETSGSGVIA